MDSFEHQYRKKIIASFTDNIEIQGVDKVTSTAIHVIKILVN